MKTGTKIIIGLLVAVLAVTIGVTVFMATQSSGSDLDPILSGEIAEGQIETTPEPTVTPEPTEEPDEGVPVSETIIRTSQDSISGYVGKTSIVTVTIEPESAELDYEVTIDDENIASVSKTEEGFSYELLSPGKATVTVEAENSKKKTLTITVAEMPVEATPIPSTKTTTTTTTPTTVSTPVPTAVPASTPAPADIAAWSEGDLNNYDPQVDSGNVNVCEYDLNGQKGTARENEVPAGANIISCYPQ